MDVTAVVLAGGLGTRIRAVLPDTPKPMAPVAGEPFLHWVTAYLANFGLRDFVYSTGYKGEQVEAWTHNHAFPRLTRRIRSETQPLGTGGGLLNCLDACGEWVLAVNGDSLCIGGLAELLRLLAQKDVDGGLIGVHQEDASRFGSLEFDADSKLLRAFREKAVGSGYVNAGVYLFRTCILRAFPTGVSTSIEKDLIPALLAEGRRLIVAPAVGASFIDIGTPETIAQAEAFIAERREAFG